MASLVPLKTPRPFLPVTRADMAARGWEQLDIIIVSGDAYVDHPAFGPPLIARFLEGRGFKVGIIPQPDWHSAEPFKVLGKPRLFFGVAAGNMDSMLNRLTAQKKNRSADQYSPGGRTDSRPDRASIVYAQRCREAFPDVPIVLGGIEASLRRIAHFDYWSEKVRRSIVMDAKVDLLVFGMGERPIWEIADRMNRGEKMSDLKDVRGTAYIISNAEMQKHEADPARRAADKKTVVLPSYEEVIADKVAFARMTHDFQLETNPGNARPMAQRHGDRAVYFNPPAHPLDDGRAEGTATVAMDELYDLPFNRVPHPMYKEPIPAYETVKHSVVLMRGCFGGCSFCSITEHEGRVIQSRSGESVLREIRELRRMGDFRGTVTDLGGPTANMYKMKCKSEAIESKCRKLSCVHPGVCENLVTDHGPLIELMRDVRQEEGVKHVFIASGVRYDLAERSPEYVKELAAHHVGGQLSVAPEHVSPRVLEKMKKPGIESFERFQTMFACASKDAGKEQYDIPYFISGHPGSTLEDMVELAQWLKKNGKRPRQVQDFIPTPMSMAACMYYSGMDPMKMEPVYTATGLREKRLQKALLLYWNPEQWPLAREALRQAGREDLIGRGPHCLVPPETPAERARLERQAASERPLPPRPRGRPQRPARS
ncbi:YgiQ family radical SAM protein [Aggregicoccus sp. 17bor-14]|uniref:YgiQ family radical SAM protein n=1 Tax=Myxococcaceae TaxID=31 RepID=UPI00129CF32A|nr:MULTISPECIES: YgiQ family radical SAM protein [Myxococcaceae]MBF5044777.1 YgiQ family radical SAM protein [Simulacricoccus sp. 17bor-14]MRI90521.1 YgiQ family radical SAM protein [Aggregicoccus sp. 17bor-14]